MNDFTPPLNPDAVAGYNDGQLHPKAIRWAKLNDRYSTPYTAEILRALVEQMK